MGSKRSQMQKSVFQKLGESSDWRNYSPGLERVQKALNELNHPDQTYQSIVVGGTNGKGSVCYNLARRIGSECGLFMSPHLTDVRERITTAFQWLPDEEWEKAYLEINAKTSCNFSYFEWLFLLATVMFRNRGTRMAVFEIGMGGRLDAVNALNPIGTVITSIGLDHTEYLGTTIPQITMEKLGIARKNVPLFFPDNLLQYDEVRLLIAQKEPLLIPIRYHQGFGQNEILVEEVTNYWGLNKLPFVKPPGRREKIQDVFLDTAHNLDAWIDTHNYLNREGITNYNVLFSLTGKRRPETLIQVFQGNAKGFFKWNIPIENEIPLEQYKLAGVKIIDKLEDLLNDPLLVCGNHALVGRVRHALEKK